MPDFWTPDEYLFLNFFKRLNFIYDQLMSSVYVHARVCDVPVPQTVVPTDIPGCEAA